MSSFKRINLLYFTLLFVVAAFLLNKCNNEGASLHREIETRIAPILTTTKNRDVNFILIIPGAGCQGCINEAVYEIKMNENDPALQKGIVIFTEIVDFKIFRNKVGDDFLKKENFYIDRQNTIFTSKTETIYPVIYEMKKGKIVHSEQFESYSQIHELVKE